MDQSMTSQRRRRRGIHLIAAIVLVVALFGSAPSVTVATPSIANGQMMSLSAGFAHVCGIRTDGTISCWGSNAAGQLTNIPTGTFTQISAGAYHTCAIKSDGTLKCWGSNGGGQATAPAGTFIQVSAGSLDTCGIKSDHSVQCWGNNDDGQTSTPGGTFIEVTMGAGQACAIKSDNTVQCWGNNEFGQASPSGGTFTQISAGTQDTCGVKTDGTIDCWGDNTAPQDGGYAIISNIPSTGVDGRFIQVEMTDVSVCALHIDGLTECWGDTSNGKGDPPAVRYIQVTAGVADSCGVQRDGTAICWGNDTPELNSIPVAQFVQPRLSLGSFHTCGIRPNSTIACWGDNGDGQATPPSGTFYQVSSGGFHTCAIKTDGSLTCWGDSAHGKTSPPGGTYTQVSAGYDFSCALAISGSVSCWGNDADNEITDTPSTGTFVQVTAGAYHACAIRSNGTVKCWGLDADNEVTDTPGGTFTEISAGYYHTCGVQTDGSLTCWGRNTENEVSDAPSGTFTQVSSGGFTSCAIKTNDAVSCWGSDTSGQATPPSGTFAQVSTGYTATCGVQTNGAATCWGSNSNSQFGTDVSMTSSTPPSLATGFYTHTFTATGSPTPTFSVTSGPLPAGLSLNSTSGVLSGTPTVEGTFSITVMASNGFFATDSQTFSLTIDLNPPSTTASAKKANTASYTFGTWTNQSVIVTLAATDAGTGVNQTLYTIDGGGSSPYTGPFTVAAEGNHTVAYWSTDFASHTETQHQVHVQVDTSNPTISGSPTTSPNVNNWYNGPVTIHFTCADTQSGVATCAPDRQFTGQGTNLTTIGSATDNVGHTASATSSPAVNIDFTKPSTSATGKNANNTLYTFGTWTKPSVTVTLNTFDSGGSGIAATYYTIDGGSPISYSTPFTINTAGDHAVVFWSVDQADNVEVSHTVHVQIALDGPDISGAPTTGPDGNNGWYKTAPTIHWTCTATTSPVASCPLDQVVTTEGTAVTVSGTARDQAGNTTTAQSSPALKIDHTPPVISYSGNQGTYTFGQTVSIGCSATDAVSGIASVSNCDPINAQAFTFGYGITFSQTATATDNAGNTATASTSFTVLPPSSTPRSSFIAYSSGGLSILVYVKTGLFNSRPAGILTYSDGTVSLSNVRIMSIQVSGTGGTIFGTATLVDGTAVTFRLDGQSNVTSPTVRLRLNTGYDSGDMRVPLLRLAPNPAHSVDS